MQVITKESLLAAQVIKEKGSYSPFVFVFVMPPLDFLPNFSIEPNMQREDLRRVMDLLSLKEHNTRSLLIHYRWDVEKLLTVLVEKGEDELCAEAGVTILEHEELVSSVIMCTICFEEVPANSATTMDCGHIFCNSCEYYLFHQF